MKNPIGFLYLVLTLHFSLLLSTDDKTENLLKNFETYAEAQRKAWNVQGMAIAIVKDDKVLLSKGYGQRGLTDKRPVDENTLFQMGSLSKAFTSALVAIGVDKGVVKWEDKVIEHMPSFHLADPWATAEFQVVDLLAQRSGLPPYAGDSQAFLGYTQDEMLQHLRFLEPQTSFRSQYAYQNIFFVVAAHLLGKKLYSTYPHLLQQEIFIPLKMTHSSATLEDYLSNDNRAEWLVHLKDGTIYHLKDDFPEADWNYILGAAGGINSTAKDMANWMIFQANQGKFEGKQLISSDNMQRMIRSMIFAGRKDDINSYYALGWLASDYSPNPIIWHNGATLGVYNVAAFMPQEKIGIIILTNARDTQLATGLAFQFFDMYFNKPDQNWSQKFLAKAKEEAKTSEKKPENPSSPQPLSNYVGTYRNSIFGDVIVKEEDQNLMIVFGKKQQQFTLKPWDRDIFTMAWPIFDLGSDKPIKVLFSSDSTGKIERMMIDLLIEEGEGSFYKFSSEASSEK